MSSLTDLEGVVLGLIRRNEPCTPYLVRKALQASPTAHFSDSAGSIYPLIRRLEKQGLLASEEQTTGDRRSRACSCTKAGLDALSAWLSDLGEPEALMAMDPLRTRMAFLDALPPGRRADFLRDARAAIEAQLALIDAFEETDVELGGKFLDLANDNARRLTHERMRWLDDCRDKID